jgi:hypothetical protein
MKKKTDEGVLASAELLARAVRTVISGSDSRDDICCRRNCFNNATNTESRNKTVLFSLFLMKK